MKNLIIKFKCFFNGFNYFKFLIFWLLFVTTVLLFVEAERIESARMLILAFAHLFVALSSLSKELGGIDGDDSDGGDF